jgi:uncharacterized repeat protein (TIGR03803 family)
MDRAQFGHSYQTSCKVAGAAVLGTAFLLGSSTCGWAQNYSYEQIFAFAGDTNGYGPNGALVQGADGYFYGTCAEGGQPTTNYPAGGYGTVFKVTPQGNLTTLAWFNYPFGYPFGGMIQASDGNFYGDSEGGLFRIRPDGLLTTMGGGSLGDPIQGTNGYLYTGNPSYGVLAWYSLDGSPEGLAYPPGTLSGGLIQGTDGNFYGLTYDGGTYGVGTAYKLTPGGVLTTLVSFGPSSSAPFNPYGKMLQASDGNLYGVCDSESGQVFKLTLSGTLSIFAKFGVNDVGQNPNGGLIEGSDGNFYGTTFEGGGVAGAVGTVFKITPQGRISTMFVFTDWGAYPGSGPLAGLIQGSDGNLYGTCAYGGTYGGGNIFRIVMPGPQLSISNLGTSVILSWRTNYTGYTLQSSVDLTNWSNCNNTPTVLGRQYWLTNPLSGTAYFFRLRKPLPLEQAQWTYRTNNDGTITLTGYSGPGGSIVAPSQLGGLPVVAIAGHASFRFSTPATLWLPESITSIGPYAFLDAIGLTRLILPDSITNIGDWAFAYCAELSDITLPGSPGSIGKGAFYYCTGLAGITLPNSITNIGDSAFAGCAGLTGVALPGSLNSIGASAFYGCAGLSSVSIPDSVGSIGDGAFQACSSLANAAISRGEVGGEAFSWCDALTNVTLGKDVTSIGYYAFVGCTGLVSILIPDSVATMANGAFSGCSGLTDVTLGSGLTTIQDQAFFGCTGLSSVTIPESVGSIRDFAFAQCSALASVALGSGATNIGFGAFYQCSSLAQVTILNSAIILGSDAFYNCSNLTGVYFFGNAPAPADCSVFEGDSYVTVYYLPGTTGWSNTFACVPTALWHQNSRTLPSRSKSFVPRGPSSHRTRHSNHSPSRRTVDASR